MIPVVFLDRDGVLNEPAADGEYITAWSDFLLLPGVPAALRTLAQGDRRLYVVTNQRGIARGLMSREAVDNIHRRLVELLSTEHGVAIAGVEVCPHEIGQCRCRKPGTGMFEAIFDRDPELGREGSIVVGDSLSDVGAAHALGLPAFVVGPGRARVTAGATAAGWAVQGSASSLAELAAAGIADARTIAQSDTPWWRMADGAVR